MVFDIGETARLRAKFFSKVTGQEVPADPTTATVRIKKPNGQVVVFVYPTDAEVVREGVGSFYIDQLLDVASEPEKPWTHRWEGTGAAATAGEREFSVRGSKVITTC